MKQNKESKKNKLLILVKSIDGGTGTFALSLLKINRFFKENILKIKIVALEQPSYRILTKKMDKNIIFLRNKNCYPQKYTITFRAVRSLINEALWVKKQIVDFNPDTVLSIDIRTNLLVQVNKLLFFRHIKTILTTHINLGKTLFDKSSPALFFILRKLVRFFYNKADLLVCVSHGISKNITTTFGLNKRIYTIYNGIDLKLKPYLKTLNKDEKIIISIARFVEQKDHVTLIKAFKMVNKKLPNTKLWLISAGPLKNKIENFVNKTGLTKKVIFFGWVKNIFPSLKKADIFVLSSNREGFGLVLIEAMSCGLPVISTNTPFGPSEILGNGRYGILVPEGNARALKNAILGLLTDEDKYSYYAKRAYIRSRFFSEDKMLKDYAELIKKSIK